ncbi:MAG: MFS transporter [Ktedonobacteraceae bacterium]
MTFPISSVRRHIVFPTSLQPLKEKNFGVFLFGSFLSSIGFWVQSVGQSWQVLQMTNSAFLLGLVGFAALLPNIVLSLFGGVIADRVNRRPLLIGTQIIFMSTAAVLGIFTTLHIITVWQIILMALINGTFNTVGFPAWQAFIGDLLELEQLKQGIALNSMQFNLSRVIGPALGGFSIGIFGIAGSYYLNAISYVAVIIPLILIHPMRKRYISRQQGMWQDLREGLSYVKKRPSLQVILLLQFMIAFLVFPYTILLPIFARDIFHIGAPGLGVLNSASGVGALLGAILLVILSQRLERGKFLLVLLCVIGGFASLAFAMVNILNVAILILIALGACTVMSMTSTNTALQILTPEEMRGRILSIWVMTALGLAPFGNLLAGWVAQSLGAPSTLAIGGSLCAAGALFIAVINKGRRPSTIRLVSCEHNIS